MADVTLAANQEVDVDAYLLYSDNKKRPAAATITWTSANEAVAKVKKVAPGGVSATIAGVGAGTVNITITDGTNSLTYVVTVTAKPSDPTVTGMKAKAGLVRSQSSAVTLAND